MSFFDQVYDEMSWEEVCSRLPSELAVDALLRRINNLNTLQLFFDHAGDKLTGIKQIKERVNDIVSNEAPADVFDALENKYERVLFNWLDDSNRKRLRDDDPDKLSIKFLFNSTDSDDKDGLLNILNKILEGDVKFSHLRAVLNKADSSVFAHLLNVILKDQRPEVITSILSVGSASNCAMINDYHRTIAIKAMAKCATTPPITSINVLSINVFKGLRPLERLVALERYLQFFPKYRKVPAFNPEPSKEEFELILFAGCLEYNERINKINELYNLITEADYPEKEDEDE